MTHCHQGRKRDSRQRFQFLGAVGYTDCPKIRGTT
jgi:hypothetical protein